MIDMNSHLPIINRICEEVHQKNNMASKKDGEENDSEIKIEMDCNVELLLFYAMLGLKPVGVNRHFMMMCIHQRFSDVLNKEIPSKLIWDYLDSLYDMAALHESEIIPFPNEEVDYELPTSYYELAADQLGVTLQNPDEGSNDSKSEFNVKSAKKTSSSKSKQNGTPVSTSKSVFVTPISGKSTKQSSNKSETKTSSTAEANVKIKQESPFPSKSNKVKRSSSPFPAKSSKTEQSSMSKDDTEPPPPKKVKTESSTPTSSKKIKAENTNSSKKNSKQDSSSVSKQKSETPDTILKKVKNEKDLNKKNKTVSNENSGSKKSSKLETKKPEELLKKPNDSTSNKVKNDNRNSSVSNKSSKQEDSDSSMTSGSRKSLPVVKSDSSDKKKKKASPIKRRRT